MNIFKAIEKEMDMAAEAAEQKTAAAIAEAKALPVSREKVEFLKATFGEVVPTVKAVGVYMVASVTLIGDIACEAVKFAVPWGAAFKVAATELGFEPKPKTEEKVEE